jgi:hypothetical protein
MVLSGTLVVLVLGIVAVLTLRGGSEGPSGVVDDCVVGTWTVTTMTMDLATDNFGTVHFTSIGEVGRVTYASNGGTVHDYGDNSQFSADVVDAKGARKVSLKITGTARYDVRTANSTLTFANAQATGKTTLTVSATGASSTLDLTVDTDPAKYSCQGDTLTTYTENYRAEAHRAT